MRKLIGILVIACIGGTAAARDDRWIHVRVDDTGGEKGRVDIQVPIDMVSALLPVLKGKHGRGTIDLDGRDVDVAEIRRYWNAVRSAKDGDYVTVRDSESDVRISKSGGVFRINVDDEDGGKVRVKIPVALVDAVLSGGDSIDLNALGVALAKAPSGELVTVDDDDSHVRIWIDDEPASAREDRP